MSKNLSHYKNMLVRAAALTLVFALTVSLFAGAWLSDVYADDSQGSYSEDADGDPSGTETDDTDSEENTDTDGSSDDDAESSDSDDSSDNDAESSDSDDGSDTDAESSDSDDGSDTDAESSDSDESTDDDAGNSDTDASEDVYEGAQAYYTVCASSLSIYKNTKGLNSSYYKYYFDETDLFSAGDTITIELSDGTSEVYTAVYTSDGYYDFTNDEGDVLSWTSSFYYNSEEWDCGEHYASIKLTESGLSVDVPVTIKDGSYTGAEFIPCDGREYTLIAVNDNSLGYTLTDSDGEEYFFYYPSSAFIDGDQIVLTIEETDEESSGDAGEETTDTDDIASEGSASSDADTDSSVSEGSVTETYTYSSQLGGFVSGEGKFLWASVTSSQASQHWVSAGSYSVSVKLSSYGLDTVYVPVQISKDISLSSIVLEYDSAVYSGSAFEPSVTVEYDGVTLTAGTDYTVSYSDNTDAGEAQVTISGMGSFTGEISETFEIEQLSIASACVTLGTTSYTYSGNEKKPSVSSVVLETDSGEMSLTSEDYTVTYSDNIDAGQALATVTGKGNFCDSAQASFTIKPQSLSSSKVTLSTTTYVYNGKVRTPSVTVKNSSGSKLTKGSKYDYTVTYASGRKNCGRYKVTIKGTGNYKGTVTKYIYIKPAKAKTPTLKSSTKKQLKVSWKKSSGSVTGYQIAYKVSGGSWKYTTTTKLTKTIKSLSSGKKYTVKVRAYKTINGKKYYGTWSSSKSLKVK